MAKFPPNWNHTLFGFQDSRNGFGFCQDVLDKLLEPFLLKNVPAHVSALFHYDVPHLDSELHKPVAKAIALKAQVEAVLRGQYERQRDPQYHLRLNQALLGGLSVLVDLGWTKTQLAALEAPWRWKDWTPNPLPDKDTLLALEAIIEIDDYAFAQEFVRQQSRTAAWKAIVTKRADDV